MTSINETRIRQRIVYIYDTVHAAQCGEDGIKKYVKNLERQVGIHKESMGSSDDFLKDFGGGI